MNRRLLPTIALAAFSTAAIGSGLAGCTKGPRSPYEVRQDPYAASQINYADNELSRRVYADQPRVSRDSAGLLYVNVPVRNTRKRLLVDYRFRFFDEQGNQLNDPSWQTAQLEENTFETLRGNSTSPAAQDFQLDIRYAE